MVGASVGVLCMPALDKLHQRVFILVATSAMASLPDWPIPNWGHFNLAFSHSIIVNGTAIMCLVVGFYLQGALLRQRHRRVIIGLIAAWLSHFLLDTLYVDSQLAMFWPFNEPTVSIPVPWLKTLPHVPPPFDKGVIRILMLETLTFLPLLVLATAIRRWRSSARVPVESPY